ncbi:MAG: hypothetical protein ABWZ53_04680 [Actinomycetota bacterium]
MWPVVRATGAPASGRSYGEATRPQVHRSIELYVDVIEHSAGLSWSDVCDRVGAFVAWLDDAVQLLPEIEGIAEGAWSTPRTPSRSALPRRRCSVSTRELPARPPRSASVCAHGDPSLAREADYVTVSAVIMDLKAGEVRLTEGESVRGASARGPASAGRTAVKVDLAPTDGVARWSPSTTFLTGEPVTA